MTDPKSTTLRSRSARRPRKTRRDWIVAASESLTNFGVEGLRVERLARELGVTKGSFYWHFSTRDELIEAVLDQWEGDSVDRVFAAVEARGGNARSRLLLFWREARAVVQSKLDVSLRDWAAYDVRAQNAVRRVDSARIRFLREHFYAMGADEADSEARALLMHSLLVAEPSTRADDHGRARTDVIQDALGLLLKV